jgi:hypothetical protein
MSKVYLGLTDPMQALARVSDFCTHRRKFTVGGVLMMISSNMLDRTGGRWPSGAWPILVMRVGLFGLNGFIRSDATRFVELRSVR